MSIIGICGQAGSGKDTVADYISNEYDYVTVALADPMKRFVKDVWGFTEEQLWGPSDFRNKPTIVNWDAADLAFECHYQVWLGEITDGYSVDDVASLKDWYLGLERGAISPRTILQSLGTEWGRDNFEDDLWIDYVLRLAEKLMQPAYEYTKAAGAVKQPTPKGVVISDVRFRNEIEKLSKLPEGRIVKLNRMSLDDGPAPGITNHRSEAEQKEIELELFSFLISNNDSIEELYKNIDICMACV